MFHSAFLVLAVLAAATGLTLTFLSQRYWFARAWRFAGRFRRPRWRRGVRAALIALLAATALIALGDIVANLRGTISRGSPLHAFFRLWLSCSAFAYLFLKLVAGARLLWQPLRRAVSVS